MNAPHPTEVHRIDPKDRVPLGQKSAYAMGVVSDHYAQFAINAFLMPFFNIVLKLPPTWIGTAMGIARLWDAINDPAVGSLSDHTKSRFGRRRPYLFVGAILTGIVFPLIWLVPRDWSDQAMMAWLVVALLLFYTCYSILSVPYESLGMELTPDYQERTNLFTFRTYLMKLFDLGITWLMPLATTLASWLAADQLLGTGLIIDTEPYDEQLDLLTEQNLLRTIPWVAIGVGAIIIVTGILPAIFCVERYAHIAQKQRGENPVRSLLSLLMNRPFVVVMGGTSLYLLGIMSNSVLGFYVHTYYIYDADLAQGAILGGYHGTVSLVFSFV
ncbi:MAG: MFS transporter, partial [Planctomycetota bacterium]